MMQKESLQLNVAEEFTSYPFGRDASAGDGNGEAFRRLLAKRFAEAQKEQKPLVVVLDNVYGLGGSFMNSGFGEFAREMKEKRVAISEENFCLTGDKPEYEAYIRKIREIMSEHSSDDNVKTA